MNISPLLRTTVIRAGLILVLAAVVLIVCQLTPEAKQGSVAGVIMNLPPDVSGGFIGEDQPVSQQELSLLPKDTGFAKKNYKDAEGDSIMTQIVLAGGEKRSIHRPEICLRAQGWSLAPGQVVPITLDNGQVLDVMKIVMTREVEVRPGVKKPLTSIFLYWFVGKNMTTPKHWVRVANTVWDKVVHNVNHRWAYLIVSAPVLEGFAPNGKNEEQTMQMLEKFVGEVAPQIMVPSVKVGGRAADAAVRKDET